ncbi:MAG: hypothetical protein ACTHXC_00300 [Brachybacterium sp.]
MTDRWFTMNVQMQNDAMQTPSDLADALTKVAALLRADVAGDSYSPIEAMRERVLMDVNGASGGSWEVYDAPSKERHISWNSFPVPVREGDETPEEIAQAVLDEHAIKPHWNRSGEQIFDLLAEAVRRAQS